MRKRMQVVAFDRCSKHFFRLEGNINGILKAVVAELFVKQSTDRIGGLGRYSGKKGDGLCDAELAQNVFGLVLVRRTLQGALPQAKVGSGRQNERNGYAMVVPANRFRLHKKTILFFQWSTALKG